MARYVQLLVGPGVEKCEDKKNNRKQVINGPWIEVDYHVVHAIPFDPET